MDEAYDSRGRIGIRRAWQNAIPYFRARRITRNQGSGSNTCHAYQRQPNVVFPGPAIGQKAPSVDVVVQLGEQLFERLVNVNPEVLAL